VTVAAPAKVARVDAVAAVSRQQRKALPADFSEERREVRDDPRGAAGDGRAAVRAVAKAQRRENRACPDAKRSLAFFMWSRRARRV
jgi:hypothetical protein